MVQQIFALIIILYFILRLLAQKNKKEIGKNEFFIWLLFWVTAALTIIFIRSIDKLVALLGFSGSGIQIILYISILIIFFLIFRVRLRQEKIEKNITKIIRHITLNQK